MKKATLVVSGISVVWIIGLAAVIVYRFDELIKLDLNALGDFVAGTMSPLALFWLVAGYRQLGEELKQNTDALLLQQKELAEQVKATQQVAAHAEQQAKASLLMVEITKEENESRAAEKIWDLQPKFTVQKASFTIENAFNFAVFNDGERAYSIEVASGQFEDCAAKFPYCFENSHEASVMFARLKAHCDPDDFQIDFKYTDIRGHRKVQRYGFKDGVSHFQGLFHL